MTTTDPATGTRPDPATGRHDPAGVDPDAWAALRDRSQRLTRWTDQAVSLATEAATQSPPGRLTLWRARRTARRATTAEQIKAAGILRPATTRPAGDRLRWIPPVAALGTAFVLQVIAMTDTVGGALAKAAAESDLPQLAARPEVGYLAAMLLGIAVASCAEGGAAYLMDLYDRHLMAGDSVWLLRLAMVGYVAASAAVIHWWLDARQLPAIVAWVLAGMSGSALFLWSRGSRWKHRSAMRAAGQLDPAMPKLPAAAKMFHPVRWIVTLYLVSWEPAASPAEARHRYEMWSAARVERKAARTTIKGPSASGPSASNVCKSEEPDGQAAEAGSEHGPTALVDARFLRDTYGSQPPGRNELYRSHGGNKERWSRALKAYADLYRRAGNPTHDLAPSTALTQEA